MMLRLAEIFITFIILIGVSSQSRQLPVSIKEIKVPRAIINASEPYILLDCDYELQNDDTSLLVIYWYLNHTELVYKWIYGYEPQALGTLVDRVNLEYEASQIDFEMYRAIQIINATTELSGEYSCKVSIGAGEDYKTAKMTIYAPATEFEIKVTPELDDDGNDDGDENDDNDDVGDESDLLNISCWAYGVYPKPIMILYFSDNDTQQRPLDEVQEELTVNENDGFDILIHKLINTTELASYALFTCDLKIEDTNYYMKKDASWQREIISTAARLERGAFAPLISLIMLSWNFRI